MSLSVKTTPTLTTPLIRANVSCVVATIFSSLAFFLRSIDMDNLSRLVATSFSSLALLSSSVSTANQSCMLVTTFSSLRFLSNSLSSPCFNVLRVARRCFFVIFCFLIFSSYPQPFFPLSTVSAVLFALSLPFLCTKVRTSGE